ncbi:DUF4167 domain-containing protein [Candidatus Puniceispirillum sp.]|jgi:hypothetical protein|nr:DUF4167 domain-containing protein [Alphaproteobacteria bacterium]MDC1294206.1 DUF4167 domain-containing protein [Candidatus Puniceispirillum sp.]
MRQPQNAKRGRGRGRRGNASGNHNHVPNRNTSYESNGPDVKLRGNAQQLHEKYTALAHDAATSGERISAEAYTQFADHYFRLHQAAVGVAETKRQQEQTNAASDDDTASGEPRRDQEPAAEINEAALEVNESADRASKQANSGDVVADSGDAALRNRRSPSNGGVKNGAAKNGTEDRSNLSPAQLAEAVHSNQDSDQPS